MTGEMVERVAARLCGYERGSEGNIWEMMPPMVQDTYRCKARAVIEAMREPTEAMVAGDTEMLPPLWRFMIDEALK